MNHSKHGAGESCCEDSHGDKALFLQQALAQVLQAIEPVSGSEILDIRDALGRVLAENVTSPVDVPAHTNSAMDGYAVAGSDLPTAGERSLSVVGTAWAGRPLQVRVEAGQCARIMTGAVMPAGTDTVVMQEHVQRLEDSIVVDSRHRAGQHVRPAGEDISAGSVGVRRGTVIHPAQLGVLASLGVATVPVRRRPTVAFFSTGDELRGVGEKLEEGQIYDSNRYTLYGVLTRLGMQVIDLGVVPDDPGVLESVLKDASQRADAIVTTGGVSVGEADFVTQVLEQVGQVNFWKVAMKPGRPFAFGRIGGAWFFGLPGNPVSVMTTFYQLVQPALLAMTGAAVDDPVILLRVRCTHGLKKKTGRREFQRGILRRDEQGEYTVTGTGQQGAGILSSMADANCFIVLEENQGSLETGDFVSVQPFRGLV
ncbi:MAG: molybdopterin molybdotransferase MoeA [Gammaproteobacteria bacterium]|jgi:molybdopterin molybdotransferase|nr:molybdopterin molybdotransferase MoeA [Gammaproteobacteria bacterium]